MQIKEMFVKPIDRDLKGVIKVEQNDDVNAFQELDEYVVTKELLGHFKDFYSSYQKSIHNTTDAMGVWIQGYYGSGKSHFLKILSYLLENRSVKGKEAISFFTETGKITDNFLKGSIDAAGHVSSDVILFNIDSKSAVNSKTNKEAILDVFIRVFNEHLGFCSNLPFVADLEKKLDKEGKYDQFKSAFYDASGMDWIKGRGEFFFNQDNVISALVSIGWSGDAARTWCNKAEDNYTRSIEKFASEIHEYCASKGNDHHVVFLVDEIGQYIGDDSKLMLNLQTVTEDLGTRCKGKAWVVVTSQEDIDNLTHVKGNDFSKIQARFETRLSLSSANVGEVIRIRLLSKNETALQVLKSLYEEIESVLKNIIVFTDKTSLPSYRAANEFAAVYPFIPYQFSLLSYVLKAIHAHGTSGQHLSEGERSMLAMFRDAAISVMQEEEGKLVSFDRFYEGLIKCLNHSDSNVISNANDNEHLNEFDVKVLKTLFMIKYVKEITANVENLTTLLIDSIDTDRVSLRKKIEDSLARLKAETLIQQNGSTYIFLTNEEQDVNRAIEKIDVGSGDIRQVIQDAVYLSILGNVKYAVPSSGRSQFPFNRYTDDCLYKSGQPQELSLYLVTANSGEEWTEGKFRSATSADNRRVMIHLGGDGEYCREIEECLKIQNYLTQNGDVKGALSSIISAKTQEVGERRARIEEMLRNALSYADIYIGGELVSLSSEKPDERVKAALTKLADGAYLKLGYMETRPQQKDVQLALRSERQGKLSGSTRPNERALNEVVSFVRASSKISTGKITLRRVIEQFSKLPYGFERVDISYLIAVLFNEGSLNLKMHGEILVCSRETHADVETYLTKREYEEQLIIELREKVSTAQLSAVKQILKDFFGQTPKGDDEDLLMKQFVECAREKINEVNDLLSKYDTCPAFPGKNVLEEAKSLLQRSVDESNQIQVLFFEFVNTHAGEFKQLEEKLTPITGFFRGNQKDIFKKALDALNMYDENLQHLVREPLEKVSSAIREILEDTVAVFSRIPKLPPLTNEMVSAIKRALDAMKAEVLKIVDADYVVVRTELSQEPDNLPQDVRYNIEKEFEELRTKISEADGFDSVISSQVLSENLKNKWVREISRRKKESSASMGVGGQGSPEKKICNVSLSSLLSGVNLYLETQEDVDDFTSTLKKKLSDALKDQDAVQVQR